MDFRKFQGGDPTDWVFQVEQYFDCQWTAEDTKVQMASFHLQGTALHWYRSVIRGLGFTDWAEYCRRITSRFEIVAYERFCCHIKQDGSEDDRIGVPSKI